MNEEYLEDMTPEERAEEQRWQEATADEANFKSYGHQLAYYDEMPSLQEGDPNPYKYGPDDGEKWEEDVKSVRARKAGIEVVREGLLEAERVRQEPDYSIPDDPHRTERMELTSKVREFELKAEAARQRGETRPGYAAHDYTQRAKQYYEAVQKLPPPVEVQVAQQRVAAIDEAAVNRLYDPKEKDNPVFKTERLEHDAPIKVMDVAMRAKNTLKIPRLSGPFGNVLPCHPENMMTYEIPEEQMQRIHAHANPARAKGPDAYFGKLHEAIAKFGYSSHGKLAFEPKKAEPKAPEKKAKEEPKKRGGFRLEINPSILPGRR